MAEIPVERKEGGGFPWWLIPLLLLLLLLPLLYFCNKRDTTVVTNTNGNMNGNTMMTNANRAGAMTNGGVGGNTAVVVNSNTGANGNMAGAGNSGAVITDVETYGTTADKATLVGRSTNFSSVRVERVLSDKVFTVKSGSGEFFVMLDDALDSAGGKEKQISIKHGQNVKLDGSFKNVPTGEVAQESKTGGLNNKEYAQMKGANVYLHATSVSDVK